MSISISKLSIGFRLVVLTLGLACCGIGFSNPAWAQSANITSIKPTQTATGQVPAKIVLKGSGFVASSKVLFNEKEVVAKVKAAKVVITSLPADLVASTGILSIRVVAPNGQTSNSVQLVVGSLNSINLTEPASLIVNTKSTIQLKGVVVDRNQAPIPNATISFQSLDPGKATVDASGLVTGVNSGAATIRLTSGDAVRNVTVAVNEVVSSVSSGIFGDGDIKVDPKTGMVYASDLSKQVLRSRTIGQPLADFAGASGQSGFADGTFPVARFNGPLGIGLGTQQLLLADTANQAIRRLNLSNGQTTTVIRQSDAAAAGAANWSPRGVVQIDSDLFITDGQNHVVWRARVNGSQVSMQIIAGGLGQPGLLDGTGVSARFNVPQEIVQTSANILAITDRVNKVVRLIGLPSGIVSTLSKAGPAATPVGEGRFIPNAALTFSDPKGLSVDANGNLYVTDGDSVSVISIANSTASTFADVGQSGTFKNAVAVSVAGNSVFVLDAGTGQVLQLNIGAPTITSLTPTQVVTGQSVEVTVLGTNFIPETQVWIDSQPVRAIVDSSSRLRFTLPAQSATGTLPIVIQHYGGRAEARITVVDSTITVPVKVSFAAAPTTVAQGARLTLTVNFDVGPAQGQQPGSITLDLPFSEDVFDLGKATVAQGTLIDSSVYNQADLAFASVPGGIRLILSSSKDPAKAKIKGGQGSFCTLVIPVLSNAPAGSVKIDASNTMPFRTQFNQSLTDGAKAIPFTSTPTTVSVTK